jgi:drug/metabolite transporter (DMT)-like permease
MDKVISSERSGLWYGFLGIFIFSLTLPATRFAVVDFSPTFVGLGRALVAAVFAAILLFATKQTFPQREHFFGFAVVVVGVIVGFPLLSAWAMQSLPASHGAIVIGLLPLATALAGVLRGGERPSIWFWLAAICGSTIVVAFAVYESGGLVLGDAFLLLAVIFAALGYAEGGVLSRIYGGWQVICWALLLSAPLLILPVALSITQSYANASLSSWLGFVYVSLFSMFFGFFAWYKGLAIGGIARVGQLQLLQPFLTIFASALLLSETIKLTTIIAAGLVLIVAALGRRAPISEVA